MTTHLYRSRTDSMIAGVCGGLGQYLGIDSNIVRLVFILIGLPGGIGFWIYLLLWFLIPREDQSYQNTWNSPEAFQSRNIGTRIGQMGTEFAQAVRQPNPKAGVLLGIALVILGVVFLVQNLDIPWLHWFNYNLIWPVVMIAAGIVLLLRLVRGK